MIKGRLVVFIYGANLSADETVTRLDIDFYPDFQFYSGNCANQSVLGSA